MEAWVYARRAMRGARVVGLGALLYSAGYSAGTNKFGSDPELFRKLALEDTLLRLGNPKIVSEESQHSAKAKEVLRRVLAGAEAHVLARAQAAGGADDQTSLALRALQRNWDVVVVEHPLPSVFVNPLLPDKIFVCTGLLKHGRGDGAVAMGVASELIEAVLNSDPHADARLSAYAATAQLVVLAMLDPTGLLTLTAEAFMAALHEFGPPLPLVFRGLNLHGHAGSLDADADGLKIAARAGYSPDAALCYLELEQKVEDLKITHRRRLKAAAADEANDGGNSNGNGIRTVVDALEDAGTPRRTFWDWFGPAAPTSERLEALRKLGGPEGAATALYLAAQAQRRKERKRKGKGEPAAATATAPSAPNVLQSAGDLAGSAYSAVGDAVERAFAYAKVPAGGIQASEAEIVGWSAAFLLVFAVAEAFHRKS